MLEHDVDVALAGDVPDRLAELARLLDPGVVFRRVHRGHLAPAGEILANDDALGAELHHIVALGLVRDDADRIRARGRRELHAEHPEPAAPAPHQHLVPRLARWWRGARENPGGG